MLQMGGQALTRDLTGSRGRNKKMFTQWLLQTKRQTAERKAR